MRQTRKLDHIRGALSLPDGPLTTGFADISLIHNALPETDLAEIDTGRSVFGCQLEIPVLVNAITGGNPQVTEINRALARAAKAAGFGVAVGSQTGALLEPELAATFEVVRSENPTGLVIANVGASIKPEQALQAIEMVQANALQVHLNVAQELAMPEGDRNFRGMAENIRQLVKLSPVPVIVKEVGFGLSKEVAVRLCDLGVQWVDIGGAGGTNFVAIEHLRGGKSTVPEDWGIPTAVSLLEVLAGCPQLSVIASGGIRSAPDAVKALVIGADLVGIAGLWLRTLLSESYGELEERLTKLKQEIRTIMLLLGTKRIAELRYQPLVISGKTREWVNERGVDSTKWAKRD
ncbi:MAG TPA: type 2 isopentenyl-diphosphate Delta-isomerase [Desulfobacteria bacterium]|nr:type 2 isopentenyl-diphosphate Delta-isomerase [Desulfobacteria bacterium]